MSKSPGHQQHPEHKIAEKRVGEPVQVEVNGEVIARSQDVIALDEDGAPRRYYFPRADVRMEKLQRASTTSKCPYKGTANYFDLNLNGRKFKDAVWTYEEPYDEHQVLKGRVAFWEEKSPEIRITPKV